MRVAAHDERGVLAAVRQRERRLQPGEHLRTGGFVGALLRSHVFSVDASRSHQHVPAADHCFCLFGNTIYDQEDRSGLG